MFCINTTGQTKTSEPVMQKETQKIDFKAKTYQTASGIPMTGKISKKIILNSPEAFDKFIASINEGIKELDKEIKSTEAHCQSENIIKKPFCEINWVNPLREKIIALEKKRKEVIAAKQDFMKKTMAQKK